MKEIVLFITAFLFFINTNAQKASIVKEWIFIQEIIDDETNDIYKIVNFNADKNFVFSGRIIGTWDYSKKNHIIILGERLGEMGGEWKIADLSKSELVLKKENAKMVFYDANFDKLSINNKKSNFQGIWKIIDNSKTPSFVKFELPYNFITGNTIGSKSGKWYFDKDNNSIIMFTSVRKWNGKMECKIINDSIMVLASTRKEIKIQKVNNTAKNIQFLEFVEENDTSYSKFKSSYYYEQNNSFNFNWENTEAKIEFLKTVDRLTYNKSVLIPDFEVFDKSEISSNVEFEEDKYQISISQLFTFSNKDYTANKLERENIYYPLSRPNKYKEKKDTILTTLAGSFECKVFDVVYDNGNTIARLYMIKDKPGIYARIIMYGRNNHTDNKKYLIFELSDIDIKE